MTSLLIGLGVSHRGDDGVGIEVVRRVAALQPQGVDVLEVDDPASLLDTWSGMDHVVVVDAMSSRREPGTVLTLDVTDSSLPSEGWAAGGTHALGLATAVELSRALGRLPRRLMVVGIEVESTAPGTQLSAAVSAAVEPSVVAAMRALEDGGA
jgi:hydrogenase maturation protease